MPQQLINLGATGSGAGGDSARTAFEKIISNFAELYPAALPGTAAQKQAARDMFGLGTAATKTAQTGPTDTATGALMAVGAFGVGKPIRVNAELGVLDLNSLTTPGTYWLDGGIGWLNSPLDAGILVVTGTGGVVQQEALHYVSGFKYVRTMPGNGVWSAWQLQYKRDNILGTVSQSGGVPTGAIIERGSNANGEYVRFADGTQICSGVSNMTTDTAYGSTGLYYTQTPALTTFPANFANTSYRVATAATSVNILPGGAVPVSGSTFRITGMYAANATLISVYWIAIGRWY